MQINIGDRIIVAGQVLLVDEIDREIWLVTAFDQYGCHHEVYLSDITCIETTACLLTRSELPRLCCVRSVSGQSGTRSQDLRVLG